MIYNNDEEEVEETEEEETEEEEETSLIGLCSDINEESMKEIALGFLTLNGGQILHDDPADMEGAKDVEF